MSVDTDAVEPNTVFSSRAVASIAATSWETDSLESAIGFGVRYEVL